MRGGRSLRRSWQNELLPALESRASASARGRVLPVSRLRASLARMADEGGGAMTTVEIRRRLIRIGAFARDGDFEAAHGEERKLHVDVLRAVADGKAGRIEALAAIQSLGLEFKRATA